MMVLSAAIVGIGSAGGAALRYWIGVQVGKVNKGDFPWATWIVNLAGTFLLGLFAQWFTVQRHDSVWWLVLGTGFCGGFTTFSTMSVETVNLFQTRRLVAVIYLGSSFALGLLLVWLTKWWFA